MNKSFPLLVCDFETGGFDCRTNAVTEFAGIIIDSTTFKELARYEVIFKPYDDTLLYDPEALSKTNINTTQLEAGTDLKTFKKEFTTFLKQGKIYKGEKYKMVMAGHNIGFDVGFMQQICAKANIPILDYLAGSVDYYGNPQLKLMDTLDLAIQAYAPDDTMLSHTLSDCAAKIGEELVNAHRAMNDVQATVKVIVNLIQRLRASGIDVATVMEATKSNSLS